MAQIKITHKIPSCKINKNTIMKITKIIEQEIDKLSVDDTQYSKPEWDVIIKSKNQTVTIHDKKELESHEMPYKLKYIEVSFRRYYKSKINIYIMIGFEWWNTSEIEISSTDSILAKGVLGEIISILTQNPTKNDIFHNKSTKIPICLFVSFLLSLAVYQILLVENSLDRNELTHIFGIPLVVISSFVASFSFFIAFIQHLFPKIQFEGRGTQQKFNKMIYWIITIISGPIIALLLNFVISFPPN